MLANERQRVLAGALSTTQKADLAKEWLGAKSPNDTYGRLTLEWEVGHAVEGYDVVQARVAQMVSDQLGELVYRAVAELLHEAVIARQIAHQYCEAPDAAEAPQTPADDATVIGERRGPL